MTLSRGEKESAVRSVSTFRCMLESFTSSLVVLCLLSFSPTSPLSISSSQAQELKTRGGASLFFRSVPRIEPTSAPGKFDITSAISIDDVFNAQLPDNGALNDTIVRTERQRGSLTFVSNTYNQNYIDNVVSGRAVEALDLSNSVAKQIAAYEGSLMLAKQLSHSPIANWYMQFSEDLKNVRDHLMFRVSRGADGSLGFEPRESYGKSPTFLEFRITPSTRDGLAPRLRMGEHVSLSYSLRESATFLEYNINF
jgi:hypothetical protein